jgi:hypothetical protein
MGGGLMQLVAYGAQDVYLTGNPQITFFKVVYRRHTNFSMESVRQTSFGGGDSYSWTISRSGDLVCNMFLEKMFGKKSQVEACRGTDNQYTTGSPNNVNLYEQKLRFNALLDTIKYNVEIGGQTIDKFDNLWRRTYNSLTSVNPTYDDQTVLQRMERAGVWNLPFWFCRNPGLALPLIALQYHEVKFTMDLHRANSQFEDPDNIGGTWTPQLWVDYIYLDTDERRRFAQVSHEYLIEQIQTYSTSNIGQSMNISLNFNHPVKELVWVHLDFNQVPTHHNYNDHGNSKGTTVKLVLNGQDRFSERVARYFSDYQVNSYHSGSGSLDGNDYEIDLLKNSFISETTNPKTLDYTALHRVTETRPVYVYSFALKPEEHQPSGTCNFSRIDNSNLLLTGVDTGNAPSAMSGGSSGIFGVNKTVVYAVNYNVLRVMSGMGGLAYSN